MTGRNKADKQTWWQKLALAPPDTTVLTDHAMSLEESDKDIFNLSYRLGPLHDIIRHPKTKTPLAIAVYGDWGTGKTTAMKWLDKLLKEWSDKGEGADKKKLRCVWFYPWKYHTKEDVWRGLISEVIINSIDVENASLATVSSAAKQFGMFLGRSFLRAMAGLTLKVKDPTGIAEAELKLEGVQDILQDYRETSHPEKAYLNDFEASLEEWVKNTIGRDNERMVIFIDDLDRCMPDVALEVLEALKLYLNIEDLIFVIGVDPDVIKDIVLGYYGKLGLPPEKSQHYLAKMFQVQVDLRPNERQIAEYLDTLLDQAKSLWLRAGDGPADSSLPLEEQHRIFRGIIFRHAERNPRETKRLVNDALIAASGARKLVAPGVPRYTFAQSLQLFFVRHILEKYYSKPRVLSSAIGNEFFGAWSTIVRENCATEDFPRSFRVPLEFIESRRRATGRPSVTDVDNSPSSMQGDVARIDLPSFAPEQYHGLLQTQDYVELLDLLADHDLGELMRVQYPADTTAVSFSVGLPADADEVRRAVAKSLGKDPETVVTDDYHLVSRLNLEYSDIASLSHLKSLTNLRQLYITGTQVSDLSPLRRLTQLEVLGLTETMVSDLSPLANLTSLQHLYVTRTRISDLSPLTRISGLVGLYAGGSQVSDLLALTGLTNLQRLEVNNTKVSDLSPLRGLTKLEKLDITGTQVPGEQVDQLRRARPKLEITR